MLFKKKHIKRDDINIFVRLGKELIKNGATLRFCKDYWNSLFDKFFYHKLEKLFVQFYFISPLFSPPFLFEYTPHGSAQLKHLVKKG